MLEIVLRLINNFSRNTRYIHTLDIAYHTDDYVDDMASEVGSHCNHKAAWFLPTQQAKLSEKYENKLFPFSCRISMLLLSKVANAGSYRAMKKVPKSTTCVSAVPACISSSVRHIRLLVTYKEILRLYWERRKTPDVCQTEAQYRSWHFGNQERSHLVSSNDDDTLAKKTFDIYTEQGARSIATRKTRQIKLWLPMLSSNFDTWLWSSNANGCQSSNEVSFLYKRHQNPLFGLTELPSAAHLGREILYLLEKYQTVIVVGQTGCGKTTRMQRNWE